MNFKILEEWVMEDKVLGLSIEKLFNISMEMKPIFEEIGII